SAGGSLAPPAKNVLVYRNGDPFFPGRRFVVNQRRFLTLEMFLNEVTKSIDAPMAVRNLYTPQHGSRVAGLGDLQDGCQYVAAGFERFKKLDPGGDGCRHQWLPFPPPHLPQLQDTGSSPALGCFFHSVFRNGDLLSPPFPLPVSKSTLLQWDSLLATVTEKAALHSGAVSRLCRLDGTWVSGGEELVNGGYYVAVGNEEYKKLPYFELLVPQDPARRTLWYVDCSRGGKAALKLLLFYKLLYEGLSELCAESLQLDGRRMQTTGAAEEDKIPAAFPQVQRQARKSHLKEESLFHAKPLCAGQNRRSNRDVQHWPDEGKGHCCKCKGRVALL
uniref:Doublecortin domain containing 2B n=1 Tax=Strigops habroptila TaxID=2489341 RepID=A0A672V3X7_STRHB